MDDPMHYRLRPIVHQVAHSTEGGDSFHCCPKKVCDSCFITQPRGGGGGGFFFNDIGSYLT